MPPSPRVGWPVCSTFGQPHFRKPLLARPGWDLRNYTLGDDSDSFPYFLYIMTKAAA